MLVAVGLFGVGHSKSRVRGWLRNPMLTGVVVWAVAHLLVNGDVASLVLFGWMGLWALADILTIDARDAGRSRRRSPRSPATCGSSSSPSSSSR